MKLSIILKRYGWGNEYHVSRIADPDFTQAIAYQETMPICTVEELFEDYCTMDKYRREFEAMHKGR